MDRHPDAAALGSTSSPRLFENALLDKLSRVHHLVPLFAYLPIVLLLIFFSLRLLPWPDVALGVLAGYSTWTLTEYLGHRFLFHLDMPGRWGKRIHYLIHGVHHDHPGDSLRLVMPLLMSAPIMAMAFVVLRPICGPVLVLAVWAGFIAGYVGYDMVHYHVHHARPRTRFGQMLRRRHLLHHFHDHASWFGVSAPWWDDIFGTKPPAPMNRTGLERSKRRANSMG
jgi:dihydroceramide fatty acyl 2-hydroxylase